MISTPFLDATMDLNKRSCLSIRPSISRSVGPFHVTLSVFSIPLPLINAPLFFRTEAEGLKAFMTFWVTFCAFREKVYFFLNYKNMVSKENIFTIFQEKK